MEKGYKLRDRPGAMFWAGYLVGGALFGLPRLTDSDIDAEKLQQNNQQVHEQLAESFDPVNELILDGDSFTFQTESGSQLEVCSGAFERNQDMAQISGALTCARTTTLENN